MIKQWTHSTPSNMETDFLYHLKRALEEYKALKDFSQSNNDNPHECREKAVRACHLAHSPISNLVEAYCQFREVKNNEDNLFSVSARFNNLIDDANLKKEFCIQPTRKESTMQEQTSILKRDPFSTFYSVITLRPSTSSFFEYLDMLTVFEDLESSKRSLKYSLDYAKRMFSEICAALSKATTYEWNQQEKPKDSDIEYVNKWMNRTVTFLDILENTSIDYWKHIFDMNLDSAEIDLIEEYQSKIFDDRIKHEVEARVYDFDFMAEPKRTHAIKSQISLIEQFLAGDKSEFHMNRLYKLLKIEIFEEVLIAYDNLLISDSFMYNEKLIYNPSKYRTRSADYVAHVLYFLLKQLYIFLESPQLPNTEEKQHAKAEESKPIRKSFGFRGDVEILRNVLYELSDKVNLLHDKLALEALVSLMTTDDYRSEEHHIRLGCETVQFAYITGRLIPFFKQIKPIDIEESKAFFSKLNNKQILARDIHGKQDADVKSREEIDKIISHLK